MITGFFFLLALSLGSLLGYQIGLDKRGELEIELKHLRVARDAAIADSQFWRKLYQNRRNEPPKTAPEQ
jgi:hypothetical protein